MLHEDRKVLRRRCAHRAPRRVAAHTSSCKASAASMPAGTIQHLSGTIQDVTELKRAEERIRHLAYYDGITGLPNRQYFMERLQHALVQARRHDRQLGVLSLDLDQFKRINDTLGHSGGQRAAGFGVAGRLADVVRRRTIRWRTATHDSADAIARLDGDEFSLLDHRAGALSRCRAGRTTPARGAAQTVQRGRPGGLRVGQHRAGAVPARRRRRREPDQERRRRDALRQGSGARQLPVLQPRDERHRAGEAAMESQLRKALERDELLLHYQPKIRAIHRARSSVWRR